MSDIVIGALSFPVLLGLIFARVPIGLAMFTVGFGGLWLVNGNAFIAVARLKSETYTTFSSYSLSIIPMFLLMGHFATLGGMSQALFKAAESWLGHRKGGVAMAAIGACAGFGAICGSSLATAATMSRVALPELKRYGYSGGFSSATLAAGGTLGILIPPSVVLVIYAILTEQNIAKMFLAAFVPGIVAALGYVVVISIYVRLYPGSAGTRARMPYAQRFRAVADVWPVLLVFGTVVGGIYLGWFTPTEGAAVGALGTGIIAWFAGGLNRATMAESFYVTARSTAMIFFIVLGAAFYNGFLALTQVPQELAGWVTEQGVSPWMVLVFILILYLLLGCVMDSLSMILLTIPIFWPIMIELDFGFVSMIDLHAAKFDTALSEGMTVWNGLSSGSISDLSPDRFSRLLADANAQMATLGLGSVADAGTLSENQIIAIVNETTPEMVQQARDVIASGGELGRDMLRDLNIRGANEGALNRINVEQTAIWFGILVLIVVEVGLITPPVGMNLFIINAMDRTTPMIETYKAVMFFVASDLFRVVLLVLFPAITLFLIPWY
ncbi:TRAP transporter large permease [Sulfitobacter guttiformis]|uniref:Tripartite ATP-independent transporter DctM subunit n=1 Tax=Sulfitobacter guttiformis TaxID=74349 RepID=A0A420DTP2_9RHOB|nr:TRAP transporter large permease [Sulfitobacter guttiformis]KIN71225.1 TRAP c4-dicarboxylate transport system permease dctm subunit [Sulfitobacter guttiformis KCTC 32187]RKE97694.1 tripartite ATP-independent transporter DctM subunit [Sulfitobacter guttiformis]